MRETYEYAVVDVDFFKGYPSEENNATGHVPKFQKFNTVHLQEVLNEYGKTGFRIVTVIEDADGKLILMSKAVSK